MTLERGAKQSDHKMPAMRNDPFENTEKSLQSCAIMKETFARKTSR